MIPRRDSLTAMRFFGYRTIVAIAIPACSAPTPPHAPPVVHTDPQPGGRQDTHSPRPAPRRCVVRGDELGGRVVALLPPQGGDDPWARMQGNVAGRYRLDVTASVEGRAPLAMETDTIRLDGVVDITSLQVFARRSLDFGPVVASMVGHSFSWTRTDAGRVRLRLDLGRGIQPRAMFREVDCDDVRLGGVDYVSLERPPGFEERGAFTGPGMVPLLARPDATEATLHIDPAAGHVAHLGRTIKRRREVFLSGLGYAMRAWVPEQNLGPLPAVDLGKVGTIGTGSGRVTTTRELTLTCPHEVSLYAVRGEASFLAATMKPGPEVYLYARKPAAPGRYPVEVQGLPLFLVGGYQFAVEPGALDGCKPPRDEGDIPF